MYDTEEERMEFRHVLDEKAHILQDDSLVFVPPTARFFGSSEHFLALYLNTQARQRGHGKFLSYGRDNKCRLPTNVACRLPNLVYVPYIWTDADKTKWDSSSAKCKLLLGDGFTQTISSAISLIPIRVAWPKPHETTRCARHILIAPNDPSSITIFYNNVVPYELYCGSTQDLRKTQSTLTRFYEVFGDTPPKFTKREYATDQDLASTIVFPEKGYGVETKSELKNLREYHSKFMKAQNRSLRQYRVENWKILAEELFILCSKQSVMANTLAVDELQTQLDLVEQEEQSFDFSTLSLKETIDRWTNIPAGDSDEGE